MTTAKQLRQMKWGSSADSGTILARERGGSLVTSFQLLAIQQWRHLGKIAPPFLRTKNYSPSLDLLTVACFLQVAGNLLLQTVSGSTITTSTLRPQSSPLLIGCVHPQDTNYNDVVLHTQQSLQKKPSSVESPRLESEFESRGAAYCMRFTVKRHRR